MIVNRQALIAQAPIIDMTTEKHRINGVSYGLAEAGYDIRIKQEIWFSGSGNSNSYGDYIRPEGHINGKSFDGNFTLASAIEEFQMPPNLVGLVKDKSTWARRGLSVFNTVIEPGWNGFLTLELVYHGPDELHIPAGSGIAQVLFEEITHQGCYEGKYQHQADLPVEAKFE